jgi:hypothetical protein
MPPDNPPARPTSASSGRHDSSTSSRIGLKLVASFGAPLMRQRWAAEASVALRVGTPASNPSPSRDQT